MRLTLNSIAGFGFDGGHFETKGLSPSGEVIQVARHRHRVSLDVVRVELGLEVTFAEEWDVWLRVPYEIKRQVATIELAGPTSPADLLAAERNRELHHRTDTYTGLADLMLLLAHRERDLLAEGDVLTLAAGITVPTGATEHDPFEAGRAGERHLHLQFGTGTVDPLLEAGYFVPLPQAFTLDAYVAARVPLYENAKGYQGPIDLTASLRLGRQVLDELTLYAGPVFFRQGFATWDGDRDENTGLLSVLAEVGAVFRPGQGLSFSVGVRLPLHQETLASSGDTFEQGPTFLLSLSWLFG